MCAPCVMGRRYMQYIGFKGFYFMYSAMMVLVSASYRKIRYTRIFVENVYV